MTTPRKPVVRSGRPSKEFSDLLKCFPGIWGAYSDWRDACDASGPLEETTRALIKVGIATALQYREDLRLAVRECRQAGASHEEVLQAMLLAAPVAGLAGVLTATPIVRAVFRE